MFVYLSKKIGVPNNVHLNCIAWNQKQGYIAVGGEDGLLKVLKADSSTTTVDTANSSGKTVRSTSSVSNLSMNQNLEGHVGHVQVVVWNEEHQKLTSSDQNGVVCVWVLYKGSWYEEMINNRNKSTVKGMAWASDGQKICIVYEDGAIIVGSVEGNRIWGKDLKGMSLTSVQWSPDDKMLIFGSRSGEAHVYDDQGLFLTKLESIDDQSQPIVTIHWYNGKNGYIAIDCPTLAVCFLNGRMYLLKDVNDDRPIKVDTGLSIACCVWNTYGSLLAITGTNLERKDSNVVNFYSAFGEPLRTLRVPGKDVSYCSWEGGSLRICFSVDSSIYFANIRPSYKWAYFGNTVVFTDEKVSKDGVCVTFWDTVSNARYFKYVRSLVSIAAHGEHCVLAAKAEPGQGPERYVLYVCNAISTPIDTKHLELEPLWVAINSSLVIAASRSNMVVWNFRNPRNSGLNPARARRHRLYHVDDTPTGATEGLHEPERNAASPERSAFRRESADPVCCIAASDRLLLVARESGMIQQYSLPAVSLSKRHASSRGPWRIGINSDSTRAAVIDAQGVLRLVELAAGPAPTESDEQQQRDQRDQREQQLGKLERRDAWALCWAADNPSLLAVLEKNRMYVFRGAEPEEPLACAGYVCSFSDLQIRCVLLDELVRQPEAARAELLLELEVKSLRDTRQLLARVGLAEAEQFVRDNPHPRLWRLLAEHALREGQLDAAEAAMVRCADYLGIRFVKRLRGVLEPGLRRAEALAFLGEFDAAEQAYLELDRRDLAVALRQKLADYPRALQLMGMAGAASDAQLEQAHARWGEQLAGQQRWREAREHLERGRDLDRLLDCHYRLEEYEQLAASAAQLAEQAPGLRKAARMLASVGMCQQAVACYVRCGDVRRAVETCVRSNRWGQALELARQWRLPGIKELLAKYAGHLLAAGRRLQAIELYRKADCPLDAARLLLELAAEQARAHAPPLRLKKIYVLAALLVQEHADARPGPLLMGLAEASPEDARLVEEAWRGAEAYHLLLLAHRQLYAAEPEAAMRTALRLREYEELLEPEALYALLALASAACRAFAACSRAFVRLETIHPRYEQLALELFANRPPADARPFPRSECTHCETLVPDYCVACPSCATPFPVCIASGRPLLDHANAWLCMVCKHRAASERDVVNVNGCPLCHSIITYM